MVITLMVLALVTALSTTVAVVTIDNLQGSRRAHQAGIALSGADAGIAQAMTYLRTNGVRDLTCTAAVPTSASCAQSWGSANPAVVHPPGNSGQAYSVWIEMVQAFPDHDPGLYRIHALGTAAGDASRQVLTDVYVSPTEVPLGIFAQSVSGGGNASVSRESIISTGCVIRRSQILLAGDDAAYKIPAAVHSSKVITDSNDQTCPTSSSIHRQSGVMPRPCNTAYPHDQDAMGGAPPAASACVTAQAPYPAFYGSHDYDGGGADVLGSYIKDDAALHKLFGTKSPALSQSQIDQLRTTAIAQGNYSDTSDRLQWAAEPIDDINAVLFFDLRSAPANKREVDLNDVRQAGVTGRTANLSATDPGCTSRSLVIVIEEGDAKLNSNTSLAASVFLTSTSQYGEIRANGTSNFVGTLYAKHVDFVGNNNVSLDPCFMANLSPALMDFTLGNYRELDR